MTPTPLVPSQAVPAPSRRRLFPRSRSLLFSLGLFVVLDLGILALVWTYSFRLSVNAIRVELASRQRVLCQRTAKCLYQIRDFQMLNRNIDAPKKELLLTRDQFEVTLRAFRDGGTVPMDEGTPAYLSAVEEISAQKLVNDAQQIWDAYQERLSPIVTARESVDPVQLQSVIEFSNTNNLKLLNLMSELTTLLEAKSQYTVESLRLFQTLAVLVSLLNLLIVAAHLDRRWNQAEAEFIELQKAVAVKSREPAQTLGPDESPLITTWQTRLEQLAQEHQKQVVFLADARSEDLLRHSGLWREIIPLLLEHVVKHHLETPLERLAQKKSELGRITLSFTGAQAPLPLEVVLHDDGRGLDLAQIRRDAIKAGLFSEAEALALTEMQLPPLIFAPKFNHPSDPEKIQGLSLVKQRVVDEAGGEIQVRSRPGQFTEFRFILPRPAPENLKGTPDESTRSV